MRIAKRANEDSKKKTVEELRWCGNEEMKREMGG